MRLVRAEATAMACILDFVFSESKERLTGNPYREASVFPAAHNGQLVLQSGAASHFLIVGCSVFASICLHLPTLLPTIKQSVLCLNKSREQRNHLKADLVGE